MCTSLGISRRLKLGSFLRSAELATKASLASWLEQERGLKLKDPGAVPRRTDRCHLYLGFRVSRCGLQLGPKARGRLPGLLQARVEEPERLAASLHSIAAVWRFG